MWEEGVCVWEEDVCGRRVCVGGGVCGRRVCVCVGGGYMWEEGVCGRRVCVGGGCVLEEGHIRMDL